MTVLKTLLIFCARMLAALGVAATAIMLGWIITAHAANLVPDQIDRPDAILCARSEDTICPPYSPGLVSKPATLVLPARGRAVAPRTVTSRLTKF